MASSSSDDKSLESARARVRGMLGRYRDLVLEERDEPVWKDLRQWFDTPEPRSSIHRLLFLQVLLGIGGIIQTDFGAIRGATVLEREQIRRFRSYLTSKPLLESIAISRIERLGEVMAFNPRDDGVRYVIGQLLLSTSLPSIEEVELFNDVSVSANLQRPERPYMSFDDVTWKTRETKSATDFVNKVYKFLEPIEAPKQPYARGTKRKLSARTEKLREILRGLVDKYPEFTVDKLLNYWESRIEPVIEFRSQWPDKPPARSTLFRQLRNIAEDKKKLSH